MLPRVDESIEHARPRRLYEMLRVPPLPLVAGHALRRPAVGVEEALVVHQRPAIPVVALPLEDHPGHALRPDVLIVHDTAPDLLRPRRHQGYRTEGPGCVLVPALLLSHQDRGPRSQVNILDQIG